MTLVVQGGGEGVRGPSVVVQGATFSIEIGPNDSTVEVSSTMGGKTYTFPVVPGKQADLPVPPVPAGTTLIVTVGRGSRRRVHAMEVVALSP
jgi:hypothetical protein